MATLADRIASLEQCLQAVDRVESLDSRVQSLDPGCQHLASLYRDLRPYLFDDDLCLADPDHVNAFIDDHLERVSSARHHLTMFDSLKGFASNQLPQLHSPQVVARLRTLQVVVGQQRARVADLVVRVEDVAQRYYDEIHRLSLTFSDLHDRVRELEQGMARAKAPPPST